MEDKEVLREVCFINTEDPSKLRTLHLFEDRIELSGKDGDECIHDQYIVYAPGLPTGRPIGDVFFDLCILTLGRGYEVMEDRSYSIKAYEDAEK